MSASRFNPVRLDPAHPGAAPSPALAAPRHRVTAANTPRMRVLLVISSRAAAAAEPGVLDPILGLVERVALAIAIVADHPEGLARIHARAARFAIPVHDAATVSLRSLLRRDDWDLIETTGGLDSAASQVVLDEVADRALVHTVTQTAEPTALPPRLIGRADAVLCSTSEERSEIQRTLAPGRNHCFHLAPGSAFAAAKWEVLAATWFTRHYLDRPFQGPRPLARSAAK